MTYLFSLLMLPCFLLSRSLGWSGGRGANVSLLGKEERLAKKYFTVLIDCVMIWLMCFLRSVDFNGDTFMGQFGALSSVKDVNLQDTETIHCSSDRGNVLINLLQPALGAVPNSLITHLLLLLLFLGSLQLAGFHLGWVPFKTVQESTASS